MNCPVCEESLIQEPEPLKNKNGESCVCPRCGSFHYLKQALQGEIFQQNRHLISAWIRRQNDIGIHRPFVPSVNKLEEVDEWYKSLKYQGFPITVTEKLNALLHVYADLVGDNLGRRIKVPEHPEIVARVAVKNMNDVKELTRLLDETGEIGSYFIFSGEFEIQIKIEGWKKLGLLKKNISTDDSAFIAMWFDDSTRDYRTAVQQSLLFCGYQPLVVDQIEFNGFIMDKVLALIRQSRFIVSDFTSKPEHVENGEIQRGVRGGVYWESGLAYGMGKQVIHTCQDNEESKKRIHFDVKQYRTLFWKPEELKLAIRPVELQITNPNFKEQLVQRILGTIGKGNYGSSSH
jgi:hypothetical protein